MEGEVKKSSKGFAIVALIMGILAIINSFIPVINFISYIFAVLGIIFGIIGIVKKNGRAMAIVGLVLAGVAIILASVINGGTASLIDDATSNSSSSSSSTSSSKEKFSYTVDKQYLGDYGIGYYIEGSVKNLKDKDYSYVQIEFICYDADGNNLGTAIDNTNNLLGNQTWKYKAIFLGTDESIDHCDYHEITGW